jgi:hypothetical protein
MLRQVSIACDCFMGAGEEGHTSAKEVGAQAPEKEGPAAYLEVRQWVEVVQSITVWATVPSTAPCQVHASQAMHCRPK